ncbi:42138_t:CDS:2, partial [Gigaspora margarita]
MTNSLSISTVQQHFECKICSTSYKTKKGLTCYQNTVQKYNIRREELYTLPLEAITQFKADLIHIIRNKLKAHFKQLGKQTISFPCLESLFFGVFEDHIHYFNSRNGSYKCFFQGPDAYAQLTGIFNNSNWGRKFFDNDQQTFVLLFDAQAEKEANCNLFNKISITISFERNKYPENNPFSLKQNNTKYTYNIINEGYYPPNSILHYTSSHNTGSSKTQYKIPDGYLVETKSNESSSKVANEYLRKKVSINCTRISGIHVFGLNAMDVKQECERKKKEKRLRSLKSFSMLSESMKTKHSHAFSLHLGKTFENESFKFYNPNDQPILQEIRFNVQDKNYLVDYCKEKGDQCINAFVK